MYLLHAPYGGQKIREACYKAVLDAVDDGEVKIAGVSNFGVGIPPSFDLSHLSFPNDLKCFTTLQLDRSIKYVEGMFY